MDGIIGSRLAKIRCRMQEEKIDAYIIRSSDFHDSEYVGDYFKCREYISGFTGSAGDIVILQNKAGLWTDGRYFLQAEQELAGSGITLLRIGEEDVPDIEEYILQALPNGAFIGIDGRTMNAAAYLNMERKLKKKQIGIKMDYDLVGEIWRDRPQMSCTPAWELDISYSGESRLDKLTLIRTKMKEEGADSTVISSLDDIAWLLNIRGGDIACTPVVLSFFAITNEHAIWFVQEKAVSASLADTLRKDGVTIREYNEIYDYLSKGPDSWKFYLDLGRINMMLYQKAINPKGDVYRKIIKGRNLTVLPKAVKNPVEIENMRIAHIKDAVACIQFMYWLKTHINDKRMIITEMLAEKKLEELRSKQEHYLGPSFEAIIGYKEHGAIVHYHVMPETDKQLEPCDFLLVDSGGHYLEGTTDITRTIALGELTQEQKHYYTLVLKGNIRLAAAKFKYGSTGISLDYLAREALAKEGLDYNHGTGHGVGYLLCVHEPPNSFRSRVSESGDECVKLEEGMITSNEPGLYLNGKYGIRLENLVLCKKTEKNEFGQFMAFETLTLVPFERDAIILEELTNEERDWLNAYHNKIFEQIGPHLKGEEKEWLQWATAKI